MSAYLVGLVMGLGWVLILNAVFGTPLFSFPTPRWYLAWVDQVTRARVAGLTPLRLVGFSAALMVIVALLVYAWTGVASVAGIVSAICVPLPQMYVAARARTWAKKSREAWPEVIDSLVSGVRAGSGLPELLAELGETGPEELRPAFVKFALDYRAEGRFDTALTRLKERLADPVADRIIEALRLARAVGGADLSLLLRDLGVLLREDARMRGELEARQSWTVNAARLAVVAPWLVLLMVSAQPKSAAVWNTPAGVLILVSGAGVCVLAYFAMRAVGRLSSDPRTLR